MADDHTAFLAAIVAAPDDDLPRLVYADWLDERGDPRAEFIRVQVELVTLERAVDIGDPRKHAGPRGHVCDCDEHQRLDALRRRERDLLDAHALAWFRLIAIPGFQAIAAITNGDRIPHHGGWLSSNDADGEYILGDFRRGFVETLSLSWDAWMGHRETLLKACPVGRIDKATRRVCDACHGGVITPSGELCLCTECDGTGTVPAAVRDWRGQGLVRLTTWPDLTWVIDGRPSQVPSRNTSHTAIRGRESYAIEVPTDIPFHERTMAVLASEWPNVVFDLVSMGGGSAWNVIDNPGRLADALRGVGSALRRTTPRHRDDV